LLTAYDLGERGVRLARRARDQIRGQILLEMANLCPSLDASVSETIRILVDRGVDPKENGPEGQPGAVSRREGTALPSQPCFWK
jgi:hypothetical protein